MKSLSYGASSAYGVFSNKFLAVPNEREVSLAREVYFSSCGDCSLYFVASDFFILSKDL